MQAYSFFLWIFLPVQAKNNEELWRTLLAHETCHARQWHSLDRLLLEFTTAVCWWNPFFHLIKRQLTLTHEYLADRAAVEEVNPQTFVRILVSQILESRNPVLFHHFFQSPIKLRIMMLSQRNSQFVQWIFIPILLVCTALFSAGTSGVAQTPLSKPLTVVIDAGHGGEDPGATAGKLREKDIALALAKAVHDAGKERNLTIALTRDKDELPVPGNKDESLKRRVEMVNSQGADITVSLHIATTTEKTTQSSGVLVFIPSNNTATLDESKLLASYLLNGLEGGPLPINTALQQRQDNIYILDKNPKPAVLLEIGYLNNPKDAQILSSKEKLSDIAQRIAAALEAYASAKK
jgi:N-acetylmuramoyl-L-alanine amidase